jgi:hypothetical protein
MTKSIKSLKECFFSISPGLRNNQAHDIKIECAVNEFISSALDEAKRSDLKMAEIMRNSNYRVLLELFGHKSKKPYPPVAFFLSLCLYVLS